MKIDRKLKPWIIGSTAALGALAIGVGTSVGIILPKAKAAQAALEKFISSVGERNSLANKEKINYVALGDSATAGFNGTLNQTYGKEQKVSYRSYSDFLAMSLKNSQKLGNYDNFAFSGGRLSDIKKDLIQNYGSEDVLAQADLITLTIGANDILAVLNMLDVSSFYYFSDVSSRIVGGSEELKVAYQAQDQNKIAEVLGKYPFLNPSLAKATQDSEGKVDLNTLDSSGFKELLLYTNSQAGKIYDQDDLEANQNWNDREDIFDQSVQTMMTKEEAQAKFTNTLNDVTNLLRGDAASYMHIHKNWNSKIFEVIQGEMAVLLNYLHTIAPKAQIMVLGYANPFAQFPEELMDPPKPEIQAALGTDKEMSLQQSFDYLLECVKESTQLSTGNSNDFIDYYNINELADVVATNNKGEHVDFSSLEKFQKSYQQKIMPNVTDIHPSVYGYEMIGKSLFKIIGQEMGISESDIAKNTQASTPFDSSKAANEQDDWARLDEDPAILENLYGAHKGFYDMLEAPEKLKTELLPSTGVSMSSILEPLLKHTSEQLKIDKDKVLTKEEIAQVIPTDILGGKLQPIKEAVQNGNTDKVDEKLKDLAQSFIDLANNFINLSQDIEDIEKFFKDNLSKINERQSASYGAFGAISMFTDYQVILTNIGQMQSHLPDLLK